MWSSNARSTRLPGAFPQRVLVTLMWMVQAACASPGAGSNPGDDAGNGLATCTVPETRPCTCPDGTAGAQSCVALEGGTQAFEACRGCGGSGTSSSSGGSSSSGVAEGIFERLPSVASANLVAADATANDNVWAVGTNATVLHFDGSQVRLMAAPPLGDLRWVASVSASNTWVVDWEGKIAQWTGSAWTVRPTNSLPETPYALARSPQGTIWVAGEDTLARWNPASSTWQVVSTSLGVRCQGCWLTAGSDTAVFAGDEEGTLVQWNGTTLTPLGGGPAKSVRGWNDGAGTLFVVGDENSDQYLTRYQNGAWTTHFSSYPDERFSVHGCGANDVWVAGEERGNYRLQVNHFSPALGVTMTEVDNDSNGDWSRGAAVACTPGAIWVFGYSGVMSRLTR